MITRSALQTLGLTLSLSVIVAADPQVGAPGSVSGISAPLIGVTFTQRIALTPQGTPSAPIHQLSLNFQYVWRSPALVKGIRRVVVHQAITDSGENLTPVGVPPNQDFIDQNGMDWGLRVLANSGEVTGEVSADLKPSLRMPTAFSRLRGVVVAANYQRFAKTTYKPIKDYLNRPLTVDGLPFAMTLSRTADSFDVTFKTDDWNVVHNGMGFIFKDATGTAFNEETWSGEAGQGTITQKRKITMPLDGSMEFSCPADLTDVEIPFNFTNLLLTTPDGNTPTSSAKRVPTVAVDPQETATPKVPEKPTAVKKETSETKF
jgi:hypothetical protein